MINELAKVFFLSAVPVIEQRGAIPMGIFLNKIDPTTVFIVSLLGSLLPAPFILLFFKRVYDWMHTKDFFKGFMNFLDKKLNKNSEKLVLYKEIGLILFIGIPLPGTGIWTGTMVASFLKLDFKKSMLCAFLGGLISAALITLACVFLPQIFQK